MTARSAITTLISIVVALTSSAVPASAQAQAQQPDWSRVDAETLQHFQALVRLDTQNPPGNETKAVDYLQQVFRKEGIPAQRFALEPSRANIVARIKGNGKKRRSSSWDTRTS